MTILDQIRAEKAAIRDARNEELRASTNPSRWRTPEEIKRLAGAEAAATSARSEVDEAQAAYLRARDAIDDMSGTDWSSARFAATAGSTPPRAVREARERLEAVDKARERHQERLREYRRLERQVNAAAAARRRQHKVDAGNYPTPAELQAAVDEHQLKGEKRPL